MSDRLLIFNCSTDMALASGIDCYTPPSMIQYMERELELLPIWWAEQGDVVLVSDITKADDFLRDLNQRLNALGLNAKNVFFADWKGHLSDTNMHWEHLHPFPWGWNRDLARRCLRLGIPPERIPDAKQLERMRQLSSRRFAVRYINDLLSFFRDPTLSDNELGTDVLLGEEMVFVETRAMLAACLKTMIPEGAVILKAPWSSSGKGNLVANHASANTLRWAESILDKQGGLCVDRFYHKRLDFAMEFCVHSDSTCDFLGYSLFSADELGRYEGNMVAEQQRIRDAILSAGAEPILLARLIDFHLKHLPLCLGNGYEGIVGIDMMLAEVNKRVFLHPCIEINLRMNMGVVALHLANLNISNIDLTPPEHPHFRARLFQGRLFVDKS